MFDWIDIINWTIYVSIIIEAHALSLILWTIISLITVDAERSGHHSIIPQDSALFPVPSSWNKWNSQEKLHNKSMQDISHDCRSECENMQRDLARQWLALQCWWRDDKITT